MTDKEILQRAIEKAEKNNFDYNWESSCYSYTSQYHCIQPIHLKYPELIIFLRDFAQAFWGDARTERKCTQLQYYNRLLDLPFKEEFVSFKSDNHYFCQLELLRYGNIFKISEEQQKIVPGAILTGNRVNLDLGKPSILYILKENEMVSSFVTQDILMALVPWEYCPNVDMDELMETDGLLIKHKGWIYHQKQILKEIQAGRNPLKYLEKFL